MVAIPPESLIEETSEYPTSVSIFKKSCPSGNTFTDSGR
jgi:hypothetical protein